MNTATTAYPTASELMSGAKKKMSLSINEALTEQAKQLGLNLSREAELGILQAVKRSRDAQWLEQNAAAINAYNERIASEGLFGDSVRTF